MTFEQFQATRTETRDGGFIYEGNLEIKADCNMFFVELPVLTPGGILRVLSLGANTWQDLESDLYHYGVTEGYLEPEEEKRP